MLTAIIGHTSRLEQIQRLEHLLPGARTFIDDGTLGTAGNHHRALEWAAHHPVMVIEDDAIPTRALVTGALYWHLTYPTRLISLYLGTTAPWHLQGHIDNLTTEADSAGQDFLELDELIHGVCYICPTPGQVAARMNLQLPADYSIGDAWRQLNGPPVIYPTTSLADHADTGSLHNADTGPRHARRLPQVTHG